MKRKFLFLGIVVVIYALYDVVTASETSETNTLAIANLSAHDFFTTERAKYLLFLPDNYKPAGTNRWPAILFLHGIGESGTNVWVTTVHGPIKFIEKHPDFPFILISPQCPVEQKWDDQIVLKILDEVEDRYAIDTNRIYLTGLSMGGYGVWSLATTYPERFAAVAPISGGGDTLGFIICTSTGRAKFLKNLPFWAFHGAKDTTVSVSESERMINALKNFGCADVKLTIYPEAKHDAWTRTYDNPELYEWFLEHDRNSNAANAGAR